MLRNDIYYRLKPLIPAALRMGLRRRIAARTRRRVSDIWPIMPASERVPPGWSGWPDGKKFALVLTHDVEGKTGLEAVHALRAEYGTRIPAVLITGDIAAERIADCTRAMSRLQPRERAMLWLAYAEGASHREIATVLGLSPASLKPLLFRARRRLAALLGSTSEGSKP